MNLFTSHLSRVADFSGRENRKPFWLWILCVYIFQMVVGIVISVPLMIRMSAAMAPLTGQDQAYLNEHPEVVQQGMMNAMGPFFRDLMIFSCVAGLIYLALIAAAVVRRLHDSDRSGWWAAPVLVCQIVLLTSYAMLVPRLFGIIGGMQPTSSTDQVNAAMNGIMPWFLLIGLLGFVGFIFGVLLIVLLCLRGTIGPNLYGADLLPPPPVYPGQQGWQPQPGYGPAPGQQPPARVVGGPWGNGGGGQGPTQPPY